MNFKDISFVVFVVAIALFAISQIEQATEPEPEHFGPPVMTMEEFLEFQEQLRIEQAKKKLPVKKCECIECMCGKDCKCSDGKCLCRPCVGDGSCTFKPKPTPAEKATGVYAAAHAQAIREKRGLIVMVSKDVNFPAPPIGPDDKYVTIVIEEGSDPDFKLPEGFYVYEFKSDGVRPAGLYGGLYSGASSRSGVKDTKVQGPVYQCGPGGCRRVR